MKSFFAIRALPRDIDIVLLILRLVVGFAFTQYGLMKIQNPFGWMGPESTVPGVFQALAALSEFGGGIALILGFLTRLAALGIGFTMVVAIYFHMIVFGDPFINPTGGGSYGPAVTYLLFSILFFVAGAGRFSIDKYVFKTAQ